MSNFVNKKTGGLLITNVFLLTTLFLPFISRANGNGSPCSIDNIIKDLKISEERINKTLPKLQNGIKELKASMRIRPLEAGYIQIVVNYLENVEFLLDDISATFPNFINKLTDIRESANKTGEFTPEQKQEINKILTIIKVKAFGIYSALQKAETTVVVPGLINPDYISEVIEENNPEDWAIIEDEIRNSLAQSARFGNCINHVSLPSAGAITPPPVAPSVSQTEKECKQKIESEFLDLAKKAKTSTENLIKSYDLAIDNSPKNATAEYKRQLKINHEFLRLIVLEYEEKIKSGIKNFPADVQWLKDIHSQLIDLQDKIKNLLPFSKQKEKIIKEIDTSNENLKNLIKALDKLEKKWKECEMVKIPSKPEPKPCGRLYTTFLKKTITISGETTFPGGYLGDWLVRWGVPQYKFPDKPKTYGPFPICSECFKLDELLGKLGLKEFVNEQRIDNEDEIKMQVLPRLETSQGIYMGVPEILRIIQNEKVKYDRERIEWELKYGQKNK